MADPSEATDSDRICSRHMARLLTDLEAASCPSVYVQAVKSALAWLRKDLHELHEQRKG